MLCALTLPVTLHCAFGELTLRRVNAADLDALMVLLSDDPVSASRGDVAAPTDTPRYEAALEALIADRSNELLIAADLAGTAVGTMQLTHIPGMTRQGSTRLLVEAVRVSSRVRSGGIGGAMMRWVMEAAAPELGATLVQLTSDTSRVDAHRFYERLGFVASHVGFKYSTADRV